MSIQSKINWAVTGLGLSLLKRTLKKRVLGEAAAALQHVPVTNVSIFNRVDYILQQCQNKKVLHIGFTDYPYTKKKIADKSLLHLQLKNVASAVLGLDVEKDAMTAYEVLTADINYNFADITNAYPGAAVSFKPDIILLGEVLEHLQNPHAAAELLYNTFSNSTKLLVTVPNYIALDNLSASLHRTESVHPHHYWYFSPYTLQRMFPSEKFTLDALHFGMYYQQGKKINIVMKQNPWCGDCIMALFSINKKVPL